MRILSALTLLAVIGLAGCAHQPLQAPCSVARATGEPVMVASISSDCGPRRPVNTVAMVGL